MIRNDKLAALVATSSWWRRAATWLMRLDPVGWLVAFHALALTVFSTVVNPVGVLAAAAALPWWRTLTRVVASRAEGRRREVLWLVRGGGSVLLAGMVVALDGGTESPLFFSMLVVLTWEAVISPVRRFLWLAGVGLVVYLAVILEVPNVTAASLIRFGVFTGFLGLLGWARGLAEHWERESERAQSLALGITEGSPVGLAVFDPQTGRFVFTNPAAVEFGLADPASEGFLQVGGETETKLSDVLERVTKAGDREPPVLYVTRVGNKERYLRIGVSPRRLDDGPAMLLVHAEDVTAQVSVGEQHRRFLESANHQFRTPLSPILAYAEMIVAGELEGEELAEAAATIQVGARRIERLLDRIGSLLRLQREADRAGIVLSVGELIDQYVFGDHPDLRDFVSVEGDIQLPVRCDPRPASAALAELIHNGREHGQPPVTITVEGVDDLACLRVRDQGPGPDIDTDLPLGDPWSPLTRFEVMPPETGNRLGISYAHALTAVAGGTLNFQRDEENWSYTILLPCPHTMSGKRAAIGG